MTQITESRRIPLWTIGSVSLVPFPEVPPLQKPNGHVELSRSLIITLAYSD